MNRSRGSGWLPGMGAILAFLAGGCAAPGPPPGPAEGTHTLSVEVSGLQCCEGALKVALFNHDGHWLRDGHAVRGRVVPVRDAVQIVEFTGLAEGDYAIAAYQDELTNGKLDRFLGILPKEPYGFSFAGKRYRPPDFEEAAFAVPDTSRIDVSLQSVWP